MARLKWIVPVALAVGGLGTSAAELRPDASFGAPVTTAELARYGAIPPSGSGLPPGRGDVAQGKDVYLAKCAACHGDKGQGGIAGQVIGGPPRASLDGGKTIANFWPVATTLFDFIRRAMPYTQPRSLTDQEVYALTAFLLAANKLIGEDDEMNAKTLPQVKMPNRDGFIPLYPGKH